MAACQPVLNQIPARTHFLAPFCQCASMRHHPKRGARCAVVTLRRKDGSHPREVKVPEWVAHSSHSKSEMLMSRTLACQVPRLDAVARESRPPPQIQGLWIYILCHALAFNVHEPEIELRICISLLCGLAIPLRRRGYIFCHSSYPAHAGDSAISPRAAVFRREIGILSRGIYSWRLRSERTNACRCQGRYDMYHRGLILRENRYLVSVMFLRPKCLFKKVIVLSFCAFQAQAQGNATFFFNFLCAPVLTKSLLSICARQGCATSRVIHQPNNITAPHEGDGMSAAPSVARSGTIRSSFRSSFRRESSSSQA